MQAAALFDLRIVHPFYTDMRCVDLSIVATAETEVLMRRLSLTQKTFPDHVSIYAGLDRGGSSRARAAAPVALEFALRLNRGDFPLITDLSELAVQPAPLFTNVGVAAADPINLRLTTRTAQATETLTSAAPSTAETFVLANSPLASTSPAGFTVTGAKPVSRLSPDRRIVTIDTSALARGATFQITYPVRPARPAGILAEVALTLDAGLLTPAAAPRGFVVPLAAAAPFWAYYLVTDFAGDVATLRILDGTPGNGPRAISFADDRRVDLVLTPDAADAVGQDLVRRNPGRRVIRFLSDSPVPAREIPLRQIELHLGDTRLLAGMANPAPDHFVSLRGIPAPPGLALYQVLNLLAN